MKDINVWFMVFQVYSQNSGKKGIVSNSPFPSCCDIFQDFSLLLWQGQIFWLYISLLFSQRNGRTGNYANFTLAQVKFGASVTFPCWWDLDWISTLTSYHAQYFWSCSDYSAAAEWCFCLRKDKEKFPFLKYAKYFSGKN